MKKILLSVVTSLVMMKSYSADDLPTFIKSYFLVKNALVSGDYKSANVNAKALIAAISASEIELPTKTKLSALTEEFSVAANITEQRKLFIEISLLLMQSARKIHVKGVNIFFCPMKNAYWLGEASAVKNPYYGNAMLTCGKLLETIK